MHCYSFVHLPIYQMFKHLHTCLSEQYYIAYVKNIVKY